MSNPSSSVLFIVFVLVLLIVDSHRRTNHKLDSWDFLEPYVVMMILMSMLTWTIILTMASEGVWNIREVLWKLTTRWR